MKNLETINIKTSDFTITGLDGFGVNKPPKLNSVYIDYKDVRPSFKNIREVEISEIELENEFEILTIAIGEKDTQKAEETLEKILGQFPLSLEIDSVCEIKHVPNIPLIYKTVENQKVYFSRLKDVDLFNNYLSSIENLSFSDFSSLEKLSLDSNLIAILKSFAKMNASELGALGVSDHHVISIKPLRRMSAPKVEFLIEVFKLDRDKVKKLRKSATADLESLGKCTKNNFLKIQDDRCKEKNPIKKQNMKALYRAHIQLY